jgi:hypothetical protein
MKKDKQLTLHFKLSEFTCNCGRDECDAPEPSTKLVAMLELTRSAIGKPMYINSGSRCDYWNEHEGGSDNSKHKKGLAVDIRCTNATDKLILYNQLWKSGFRRFGISKYFIHADIADGACMWGY